MEKAGKRILAFNGSPRTGWNTAKLCEEFLKGAGDGDENVETELFHLSKLNYSGCVSCYACKRQGGTYGRCSKKDDLKEALDAAAYCDGLLIASPIYFGDVTSLTRAFLERLLFPYNSYEKGWKKIAPKRFPVATIYTMNVDREGKRRAGFRPGIDYMEKCIGRIFLPPRSLYVYDTYQFSDYGDFVADVFDQKKKYAVRQTQFPQICRTVYEMGREMTAGVPR